MDIFISWSGPKSLHVARAFSEWLPILDNALNPWISSEIDKGARWDSAVAAKLESSRAGIICLTRSNLDSPWIIFEAGALSKAVNKALVCPLLIDLETPEVGLPLAQFQLTTLIKEDVLRLVKTLNKALGDVSVPEAILSARFEGLWPILAARLQEIPVERKFGLTIESPKNGQRIGTEVLAEGKAGSVDPGKRVVLIECVPGIQNCYWFKGTATILENRGRWFMQAYFGGKPEETRILKLAILGPDGQALMDYYDLVAPEINWRTGVPKLTNDTVWCDEVSVVYTGPPPQ
jgi:hypothetical protein